MIVTGTLRYVTQQGLGGDGLDVVRSLHAVTSLLPCGVNLAFLEPDLTITYCMNVGACLFGIVIGWLGSLYIVSKWFEVTVVITFITVLFITGF